MHGKIRNHPFGGSNGKNLGRTNLEELKLWTGTLNWWARNQLHNNFEGYNSTFTCEVF